MQTHNRSTFFTIHTEGALLPADLLQRIGDNDSGLEGLSPESYQLAPGEKLNEAINRSWSRLTGLWGAFRTARGRLGPADAGTTLTRERWLLPLFQELGFGRLNTAKAVEIKGKSYPISHRGHAGDLEIPIHLVGCGLDLEKRTPNAAGASRSSPHSLLQEFLNRSDAALWGVVSNGLTLRILRDNAALTRQAYLEFDLESMLEGEVYSDFVLLWLVCHQSRFEASAGASTTDCLLEKWSKNAQEHGTRALDNLRQGVEEAITNLGQGFLRHPLNTGLRGRLKSGELSAQDYYRQLLRVVYRLIFLFVAEDRELLLIPTASAQARQRYLDYYSTARLRELAERQRGSRHHDRYEALQLVIRLLGSSEGCADLALPALGGFLFDARATVDLNNARLDNQALLSAVRALAFITERNIRRAVDYRNLGTRELGSVYESLLELHPQINIEAGTFDLIVAAGNERKTTGSYFTAEDLIMILLDSALDPVIAQAILRAGPNIALQIVALLALKICDPACGSGHFLIAAARRLARRLAQLRSGDEEPSPETMRAALRDVIRHCVYGVDINPMSVELCKVNLWLESLEPGKPLSFLDAHIKCGNSLVGLGPKMELDELVVPDEAFNPVTGDDKATASLLKKRNKQEREGQESLFVTVLKTREDLDAWLARRAHEVEEMPEDSAAMVQAKEDAYRALGESDEYRQQRQVADLWTAAFFWKITAPGKSAMEIVAPTHGQLRRLRDGRDVQPGLLDEIEGLRQAVNFFHWPLEFAEVATQGGFDCTLGNPPWERIKLQEEEFFAQRDPQITAAPNKASRQKLIDGLAKNNPILAQAFEDAKHASEGSSKFARASARYPLTAVGDVNTYALFAEHSRDLMSGNGQAGIIVPTGIATDDTTKDFFGNLVEMRSIATIYDFENREKIFSAVDSRMKFCLLTLSGEPVQAAQFQFFATKVDHLKDQQRRFLLAHNEIALFNPNTNTMPVFRTRADADLSRKIYQRIPVLINEAEGINAWNAYYMRMVDLGDFANDLRFEWDEVEGNWDIPLFESKMVFAYDHRYRTFEDVSKEETKSGQPRQTTVSEKLNPTFSAKPRYFVRNILVDSLFQKYPSYNHNWLLIWRDIARATDERTSIATIIPKAASSRSCPALGFKGEHPELLLATFNSLVFDYCARQKVGGIHFNWTIFTQLPVLIPEEYNGDDISYIGGRVLELVYTSWDIKPFAEDIGYFGEPFLWDEARRALLRAELDAYFARLYGLNHKQLRYILDPADLTRRELEDILDPWEEVGDPLDPVGYDARRAASDFPGETFRVLKEKELRQYGEYRTRRLVLEAWERLAGQEIGAARPEVKPVEVSEIQPPEKPVAVEVPAGKLAAAAVKPAEAKVPEKAETQPMLTDFGLYRCELCGKMVMGFEKENHQKEKHGGKSVEWKKLG